ncbi:MAG: DUF2442 domain-containing protein [Chloroflexi bacterium]|nr:DUF2442 domain-containing protein [Chloroflexota bacterium]
MSIATIDVQPRVKNVAITNHLLSVQIQDGRTVSVPLTWYPRLLHATAQERTNWRVFEDTAGRDVIFWEHLDELIPVIALLTGTSSRESKRSFERWRKARAMRK